MSRIIKTRRLAWMVATALALGALFVASGIGYAGTNSPKLSQGGRQIVDTATAVQAAGGGKYVYVYSSAHILANKFKEYDVRCPRNFPRPIGGIFDSSSVSVFLSTDRPFPFRKQIGESTGWAIGLVNIGDSAQNVIVGAVCAQ